MSEAKDAKVEAKEVKTQIDRLVSDYGAQDMGTYMDARVDTKEKVVRVAVWNEGLQSYQPTDEGIALLNTPSPKEKKEKDKKEAATKPGAKAETPVPTPPPPMHPQPGQPVPPPPGVRPPGG